MVVATRLAVVELRRRGVRRCTGARSDAPAPDVASRVIEGGLTLVGVAVGASGPGPGAKGNAAEGHSADPAPIAPVRLSLGVTGGGDGGGPSAKQYGPRPRPVEKRFKVEATVLKRHKEKIRRRCSAPITRVIPNIIWTDGLCVLDSLRPTGLESRASSQGSIGFLFTRGLTLVDPRGTGQRFSYRV